MADETTTSGGQKPHKWHDNGDGSYSPTVYDLAGGGASGGLTDAQLRASAVPVSLASVPSHAVTDGGGSLTVDAPVGTPVFVRLSDGTTAIATLPVSLASLPSLAAGTNNIGDVDVLTLPALPAGNNNIGDVDIVTLPALPAGNNNIGDVDVLTLPAIPAGANTIGNVNSIQSGTWTVQPGNTQNTTPWLVKDNRDAGVQNVMVAWEEMAGTAAVESALTNATFRTENLVALAAATSYTVPVGKRFRITQISCYVKATSTVNNLARFRLRAHATAVTNASPPVFDSLLALDSPGTVAAGLLAHAEYTFPEASLDFAAGNQVAFTWFTAANTCTVGMTFIGYLYTP